ncbi:MAG: 2-hydroxyacyl-CoA dehydratase [Coriobacteriales bacterium]
MDERQPSRLFGSAGSDTLGGAFAHARVRLGGGQPGPFRLLGKKRRKPKHGEGGERPKRVAFFNYGDYDVAFQFFVEQVCGAEYVRIPPSTKRTLELGSANSTDFVCAPYKHIMGCYIEALERGAEVLVQFAGPCRLGYYGELQESTLRSLGYEFEMVNFSNLDGASMKEHVRVVKEKINPGLKLSRALPLAAAGVAMVEHLDEMRAFYLANAGFEREEGSFKRALARTHDAFRHCTSPAEVRSAYLEGMDALRALPLDKPAEPLRVGAVGEFFTAVDPFSNLHAEDKLLAMGVELHRDVNLTNRWLRYNEANLRRSVPEYCSYDMGPTSTLTIAAAKSYAQQGFDGIVHIKSSGCTPEIDTMPVLQRISREHGIPVLFLSYDSQTSDTGLDTRLEAFYDMIARKKASA